MKRVTMLLSGIALAGALFLVACGGDSDGGDDGSAAPAPTTAAGSGLTVNMTITNFVYSPSTIAARVGEKVTVNVTNNDAEPHTFTIDGVVDSRLIAANARGSAGFTPTQAGTLSFYCTVHGRARMSGTITVSASTVGEPSDVTGGSVGAVRALGDRPASDF